MRIEMIVNCSRTHITRNASKTSAERYDKYFIDIHEPRNSVLSNLNSIFNKPRNILRLVAAAILLTILNQTQGQSNAIFNYNVGTEFHREQHNRRGKLEFRTVEKIMRCDTTSDGLVYLTN